MTKEQVKEFLRACDNLISMYQAIPKDQTEIVGKRIILAKVEMLKWAKMELKRIRGDK